MDYLFSWSSGVFDEIELVYERAEKNENAGRLLRALEEKALEEIRGSCNLLPLPKKLTPGEAEALPMRRKEEIAAGLANLGLRALRADLKSPVIVAELGAAFPLTMGCTVFSILNRLEKLDGAINVLFPKMTLELHVPLGGKKGLFQWEMLIMQLFPWLSVSERSSNLLAMQEMPGQAQDAPVPVQQSSRQVDAPAEREEPKTPPKKKSFFGKLFGK